ncbi:MAG: SPFH domain-containing protein [Spirochaetes bacterium]|nr:SPFH domain-containing protein [Spirochaetota bacterium]
MLIVYSIIIIVVLIIIKRMVKIVPDDSICIIEKNLRYHTTLKPGIHIISPFVSARIVPVEKRESVPVTQEIFFGDSSGQQLTVKATFLLWDPYTPFFTFEKLDEEMSTKAIQELSKIAAGYTKSEFEKNLDIIKKKCLELLNQFGEEYGIEFVDLDISV